MSSKIIISGFLVATALFLAGCDSIVYNIPTEVSTDRVEVHRENVDLEFDTASLSPALLQKLGQDYRNQGETPMLVSVTYDPHSQDNTARKASDTVASLSAALNKQGVHNLQVDTLPILGSGDRSQTIVSYAGLKALPPSSCGNVLDMDMVQDFERTENYKLGCSVETYTARQIARPADLLGNEIMGSAPGRYHANALDPYMTGGPNPPLSGENASD
jgi:type IV pilus biogenesis protein CpaD/CtpE